MIKLIETESRIVVTRQWREQGRKSYYLMGTEFQFEMMKKFWRWMVVIVVQHCE